MAADAIPVVALDDIKSKWPEVFQQLKDCNATLPMMIQAGEVSGINGNEVEFAVEFGLYADTINKMNNREILENVMQKVIGKPLRIKAKHQDPKKNEAVADILNEFGGTVI